jgi:hypothetical protein
MGGNTIVGSAKKQETLCVTSNDVVYTIAVTTTDVDGVLHCECECECEHQSKTYTGTWDLRTMAMWALVKPNTERDHEWELFTLMCAHPEQWSVSTTVPNTLVCTGPQESALSFSPHVEFTMMAREEDDLVPKLMHTINDLETSVATLNGRMTDMERMISDMGSSVDKCDALTTELCTLKVPHKEYVLHLSGSAGSAQFANLLADKGEHDQVLRNMQRYVESSSVPGMTRTRADAMGSATSVQVFCSTWATGASMWDMWIGTILRAHVRKIIVHSERIQIVYIRDGYCTLGVCTNGVACDCAITDVHVERIDTIAATGNRFLTRNGYPKDNAIVDVNGYAATPPTNVYTHVRKGDKE